MDESAVVTQIQDRILSCRKMDRAKVQRLIHNLYSERSHPKHRVPVLFVDSPSHAIAEVVRIYRQAMTKVEDGFMLRLQLPNADPIMVKSGVKYPTFLRWDFAAALFRTNSYVKSDVWAYGRMETRGREDVSLLGTDIVNLVALHIESWKRWSEADQNAEVFRKNAGYWPIARRAAFGRARRFPGGSTVRLMMKPTTVGSLGDTVEELAREAFSVYPYDNFAVVLEYPAAIHMDEQGRLGKIGGAAIEWRDGTGTYAAAGRMIPKVTATGKLTFKKIMDQNNAEVKRVLISHFGEQKFLKLIGAEIVAEDSYGVLYHAPALDGEREKFAMIAVTNSTPEPDGSYKTYFLRVSPRVDTPTEAVAQSFRMDGQGGTEDWRLRSQDLGNLKYMPYAES